MQFIKSMHAALVWRSLQRQSLSFSPKTPCRTARLHSQAPRFCKSTLQSSPNKSDKGPQNSSNEGIFTAIREIFTKKSMDEQHESAVKDNIKRETNYFEIVKQLESTSGENGPLAQHLKDIQAEINKAIETSFEDEDINKLLSAASPKNDKIMNIMLEFAEHNANQKEEKEEVKYYKLYLKKLNAIQSGNKLEFEECNEQLITLCEEEIPLAMHIIAKEIYKISLNTLTSKYKKSKKEMISKAYQLFNQAAEKGSFHSFYYLGEMAESGDLPGGIDLAYAYECFTIAAANGSAPAFFKLAKFYKEGLIEKKKPELEFFYTKKSAELGMMEAQHNLGVMYLEGKITKPDTLKALAWFSHAGAHGFVHSQYNAAKMYINGTEDGVVKVNYKAALVWLEKVQKSGVIEVGKLIDSLEAEIMKKEEGEVPLDKAEGDKKKNDGKE